jgi:hypothetical protein
MDEYKIIKTVEEITEEDIKNKVKFSTEYNRYKYFQVDKLEEGYMIYGHVSGDMPTSVCLGTYVRTWKKLNGVKRAIKRFSKNGSWGFFKWFPSERI